MQYRVHAPDPRLAHMIACVWTLDGRPDELGIGAQPILPDGRPELILHLGTAFQQIDGSGHAQQQPFAVFAGQIESPLLLRATGTAAVVGVRFRPDGAHAFLGAPQCELAGATRDAGAVSSRLDRAMREVRDRARSTADAVALITESLASLPHVAPPDPRVSHVVRAIQQDPGGVRIEAAARAVGLTRRHVERLFAERVGVSPKRLARILRFQRALQLLDAGVPASRRRGVHVAHGSGYADQAHFIRDFRALAGCAPGTHILRRAELTALFTLG